ncbi:MAG: tRNA preQ1(34) S-adenosylmethionine ribosyltransferase-isomerase QueA [Actinobacteria bacterium]|nr:tRNA preQ1(34) S-adenosylmethionine ribosyltransferase-isomerase QueA [Actinomycetota bacterium]
MLTSELDYDLPAELIAQHPVVPRDHSRLLVYHRDTQKTGHRRLTDLVSFLNPGDALVYNDSRVLRAQVHALKPTGGKVELLFLKRRGVRLWEALVKPSARLKEGMEIGLGPAPTAGAPGAEHSAGPVAAFLLKEHLGEGRWLVKNLTNLKTEELLERNGEMPLPPYIHQRLQEPERYQTVYAEHPGSAAAPTAGLHFTPELIGRIQAMGVSLLPLTLHIGLDTFRPIGEDELELHDIHSEQYSMPSQTYEGVLAARKSGGRIVAVGTTAVRVLETVFQSGVGPASGKRPLPSGGKLPPLEGETRLFITPGYSFRAVDALLTNFHLPRSTLLALVMAFAGVPEIRRLYSEAVRERYRFFSFGDATLLL